LHAPTRFSSRVGAFFIVIMEMRFAGLSFSPNGISLWLLKTFAMNYES
jgi:hypothetical protein